MKHYIRSQSDFLVNRYEKQNIITSSICYYKLNTKTSCFVKTNYCKYYCKYYSHYWFWTGKYKWFTLTYMCIHGNVASLLAKTFVRHSNSVSLHDVRSISSFHRYERMGRQLFCEKITKRLLSQGRPFHSHQCWILERTAISGQRVAPYCKISHLHSSRD